MSIEMAGLLAVGISILAILVYAQEAPADDMVNVNISDHEMINQLAGTLNVDEGRVPLMVQVPVGFAAEACGMKVSDLAMDGSGELANCDAMTVSPALQQAVRAQLLQE
jgi:hypothetical protein